MRLSVYRHLQRLAPRYYNKTKLGDLVSRINNDIGEVQRICSDTLLSVFSNVLFFVGSVAMMVWLNWHLFLLSVVLLPVGIVALRHYQGRLTAQTRTLRERSSDLGSFLIESFLGMRLIVASGNEGQKQRDFAASMQTSCNPCCRCNSHRSWPAPCRAPSWRFRRPWCFSTGASW